MNLMPEFSPDERNRGEKMFDLLEMMNDAAREGNIAAMDAAVTALGKPTLESLLLIAAACLDPVQLRECRRLILAKDGTN